MGRRSEARQRNRHKSCIKKHIIHKIKLTLFTVLAFILQLGVNYILLGPRFPAYAGVYGNVGVHEVESTQVQSKITYAEAMKRGRAETGYVRKKLNICGIEGKDQQRCDRKIMHMDRIGMQV